MAENEGYWASKVKPSLGKSWGEVKSSFSKEAPQGRIKGFARVGAVGIGATMAYKAIANDRTADGEERSGLARLGQAVLGGGLMAAGALAGHGR